MNETRLFKISSRATVQDGVYEQLRHALMWGQFEPSQVTTISSLATEFGTSHMPVREALRRLAAEKGLEVGRNGSARVPAISRQRLDELCLVRATLEGLATELALVNVSAADIERLMKLASEHEELGRAGHVYEMLRKNQEFHFAIYEKSQSEVLIQMIESLWLRFGPYMRLLSNLVEKQFNSGITHPYSDCHWKILDAFRAGDAATARAFMVSDIEATQKLLQEMCD